jgi:hypothetical protein
VCDAEHHISKILDKAQLLTFGGNMAFTLDTPLGKIMDDPQAKPILEKHFPGVSTNPMVGMVKGMTLNAILAMPQAAQLGLTKEKVQGMLTEVNKYVK